MPAAGNAAEQLPAYFITADSIGPREHVDIQAAAQNFYGKDVKIPDDAPFIGEITRVKWGLSSNGKMKAMSKYDMKLSPPRGLGKSPDRSEAFCFTFMAGGGIISKPKPIVYPRLAYA